MMDRVLLYRGVPYDRRHHDRPSSQPVVHVYRGHRYLAALLHLPSRTPQQALHYRGHSYRHLNAGGISPAGN